MTIRISGMQDKHRLSFVAMNVYTLPNEEYRVLPSSKDDGSYILEVKTYRSIEPIIRVTVADNLLSAKISLYPGINIERKITYPQVILQLTEKNKVSPGYINEKALQDAVDLLNQGYVVEDIEVCKGRPPVNGKNAVIEYLFEKPNIKPKLLSNGKVDYREFTKFIFVNKDQLIIKRTPADKGKEGRDITGNVIKPIEGEDRQVEIVEGVYANLEKTEFRAKYNGHIILSGNTISVLPLLQINGDVDMRVGNLRFEGTIHITGNVQSGFVLDADDIIVDGIVENAELKARNTIVIKRGVKGIISKGFIKAGGNISIGYCENGCITTGGELTIDKYCYNSIIEANTITATGKDSIISGGTIKAFSLIDVSKIGSRNSGKMEVILGYSPLLQNKAEKVKVEINQLSELLERISESLAKVNIKDDKVKNNPKVKMLLDSAESFKRRLPLLEKKYNDLNSKSVCNTPKIIVEDTIYPGVEIKMLGISRIIKSEMTKVEFTYNEYERDIVNKPIKNNEN